jgi:hypothetical protein
MHTAEEKEFEVLHNTLAKAILSRFSPQQWIGGDHHSCKFLAWDFQNSKEVVLKLFHHWYIKRAQDEVKKYFACNELEGILRIQEKLFDPYKVDVCIGFVVEPTESLDIEASFKNKPKNIAVFAQQLMKIICKIHKKGYLIFKLGRRAVV